MKIASFILIIFSAIAQISCAQNRDHMKDNQKYTVQKSDSTWKDILEPMQFHVLREKGTERPFTGIYDDHYEPGTYHCAGCNAELFESDTKYNAGCGWPSFWEPKQNEQVIIKLDTSHGMIREEVLCANCGGHLGHVFNDGPEPSQQRYCINSASLKFVPK